MSDNGSISPSANSEEGQGSARPASASDSPGSSGHEASVTSAEAEQQRSELVLHAVLTGDAGLFSDAFPSPDDSEAGDGDGDASTEDRRKRRGGVALRLMSTVHPVDGLQGTLVFFAAHRRRGDMLRRMMAFKEEFTQSAPAALFKLLSLLRYNTALSLIKHCPPLLQSVNDAGVPPLVAACSRQKPSVDFVRDVISCDKHCVEYTDARGWSPLHAVAARSSGVEGRAVARLLTNARGDRRLADHSGQTPLDVCRNPQVREVLAERNQSQRSRDRSLPEIDAETRSIIEDAPLDKLPPLKPITPSPDAIQAPSPAGASPGKRQKKLSADGVEGLVKRLFHDQTVKKEQWMANQSAKLEQEDDSRRKLVTAEEVEETVSRLYDGDLASRDEKRDATVAKYIREPSEEEKEKTQRTPEEIAAAVARLRPSAARIKRFRSLRPSTPLSRTTTACPRSSSPLLRCVCMMSALPSRAKQRPSSSTSTCPLRRAALQAASE